MLFIEIVLNSFGYIEKLFGMEMLTPNDASFAIVAKPQMVCYTARVACPEGSKQDLEPLRKHLLKGLLKFRRARSTIVKVMNCYFFREIDDDFTLE